MGEAQSRHERLTDQDRARGISEVWDDSDMPLGGFDSSGDGDIIPVFRGYRYRDHSFNTLSEARQAAAEAERIAGEAAAKEAAAKEAAAKEAAAKEAAAKEAAAKEAAAKEAAAKEAAAKEAAAKEAAAKEAAAKEAAAKKAEAERIAKEEAEKKEKLEISAKGYKERKLRASVISRFNELIERRVNSDNLSQFEEISAELQRLIDNGSDESSLTTRRNVIALRLERYNLETRLPTDADDRKEFRNSIMRLLKEEIKLLEFIGIRGGDVREELERLRKELSEEEEKGAGPIDLNGIPRRDVTSHEAEEHRERKQSEEEKKRTCEKGRALSLRKFLVGDAFESYYAGGIDSILSLRISGLDIAKEVNLLPAINVRIKSLDYDLQKLASTFLQEIEKHKVNVLPLLIVSDEKSKVNHWVGIVGEKVNDKVQLTYLDSESKFNETEMGLSFFEKLMTLFSAPKFLLQKLLTEEQEYNNCGAELIENIVLYLTGSRLSQEQAPYFHSSLWEQDLILNEIKKNCELFAGENWQGKIFKSSIEGISR